MPEGEDVFCHECGSVFPKDPYGLSCPQCQSDFTEIIDGSEEDHPAADHMASPEASSPSRRSSRPETILNHNLWSDTEDAELREFDNGNGFSRRSYRSPDGRLTFTSTTFSTGFPPRRTRGGLGGTGGSPDPYPMEESLIRSFDAIFQGLAGTRHAHGRRDSAHESGVRPPPWARDSPGDRAFENYDDTDILHRGLYPRDADNPQPMGHPLGNMNDLLDLLRADTPSNGPDRPMVRGGVHIMGGSGPSPLSIITSILGGGRVGDAVYSQEELDRVISQLVDQSMNGSGAPPAARSAIDALPKTKVDQEMLGTEGKAECSICMEAVELDAEVAVLPCKHWFHFNCIELWLNQHNTCPHCRRGINTTSQENTSGSRSNPVVISSSPEPPCPPQRRPSSIRTERHQHSSHPYHRHLRRSESDRSSRHMSNERSNSPELERERSDRSDRQNGGIGGWVRSRFGGS